MVNSLAEDIRSGDKEAFELFYRMEYANILHFVRSYLGDVESSEDVTQNTFLQLWARRENIDSGRNLRAFVFTIARNNAIYQQRIKGKVGDKVKVQLEYQCCDPTICFPPTMQELTIELQ